MWEELELKYPSLLIHTCTNRLISTLLFVLQKSTLYIHNMYSAELVATIMSMTHTTLVVKNTSRGLVIDSVTAGDSFFSVFFWWQISHSLVCVRSWRVIMPTTYKWRKKREVSIEERTLDSYQLTIPEALMTGRCLSPIVRKRLNTWGRRAWCDIV